MSGTLALEGLTVERGGRPVVKDVSLQVPAGQVTALLGPNGAGKSSLVLAIGGVLRPRHGSVRLDGAELAGKRPEKVRAAGVAIVPEGRRLLSDLTVEDNLRVATYALPKKDAACFSAVMGGDFTAFTEVDVDFYKPIIDARKATIGG